MSSQFSSFSLIIDWFYDALAKWYHLTINFFEIHCCWTSFSEKKWCFDDNFTVCFKKSCSAHHCAKKSFLVKTIFWGHDNLIRPIMGQHKTEKSFFFGIFHTIFHEGFFLIRLLEQPWKTIEEAAQFSYQSYERQDTVYVTWTSFATSLPSEMMRGGSCQLKKVQHLPIKTCRKH